MFKFQPFLAVAVAAACAACGASFSAHDGSGNAAGADNAGDANGGQPGSAGSSSVGDAGEADSGGTSAGGSLVGGAGASGGSGVGGWRSGSGGNWAGGDCATLRTDYSAAVEKARVCDKGATDQCSTSSVAEPTGCGCPVLINTKSEAAAAAKKAYQALQDNHCDYGGATCNIACLPVTSASCAQQSMGSGNTFLCTAGGVVQ
ncbi:MAG TPA: hypothetical protein VGJ91_19540 [Polyangiaceae bacterium]